jgi:primosomal protein N' (replication factor Y)
MSTLRQARVAPPLPVAGLYSYAVPPALADRVVPGVRVLVPFGGRRLTAVCVGVEDGPPPAGVGAGELKAIVGLVDDEPLVGPDLLELTAWVAAATGCSWGEALDATLPPAVKAGRTGRTVEEAVLLGDPRLMRAQVDELQEKREKQARALRILAERGGVLPVRELMRLAHVSRSPIETLVRAGLLELRRARVSVDPLAGKPVERTAPLVLTEAQRAVTQRLIAALDAPAAAPAGSALASVQASAQTAARAPAPAPAGRSFLLHGVTGSGKTEVYLQTLAEVVARGRQGIVLVPEIALTPQTVRRFRERFDRVAVLHSHLTDAERAGQWRAIRRGEADVVIGARSAIFAPVPRLGLIVLDEEHETTFKQQNVPRYHARDVALERGRLTGAVVVLGTATPSLEAWHAAQEGRITLLELHDRVGGGRAPEVVMVDLTVEQRRGGAFSFLSDPLHAAMDDALARGGQVLLFLNRRGWSPVLLCRRCRVALRCPDCEVSMTLHRRANRVICHYCGTEKPPPRECPVCRGPLLPLGYGTEKVEEEVRQGFLQASVARMDSDTMSGRGAHEGALADFAAGRTQVLIGTQMIAKGLDFPNVLLVGVICADSALFLPDYRAAERTFQLLAQVVGRTGRGPKGGRVVVQAFDPRHLAIRAGVSQDYKAFAGVELESRRESGYPPFTRLVRIVVHALEEDAARKRVHELARLLRGEAGAAGPLGAPLAAGQLTGPRPGELDFGPELIVEHAVVAVTPPWPLEGVEVLGPAPAPIARIAKQYRWHLVCKCATDGAVAAVLGRLVGHTNPAKKARVLVDVDPVAML